MKRLLLTLFILALLGPQARAATSQLSVLSFGARGDGVTDDSAAFTKGLASASQLNMPLYVPNQSFKVGSTVVATNAVTLVNDGTLLISGQMFFRNGLTWRGGTVVGSAGADPRKIVLQGGIVDITGGTFIGPVHMLTFNPTKTMGPVTISKNNFQSNNFAVLREDQPFKITNILFSANTIRNAQQDGFQWNNVAGADRNGSVVDNLVDTVTYAGSSFGGMALCLAGYTGAPVDVNNCASDWIFANNTIVNSTAGIHVEYSTRVKVVGNRISHLRQSYSPTHNGANGIELYGLVNCDIVGNTVTDVEFDPGDNNWGIVLTGGYNPGWVQSSRDVRLLANTLSDANLYADCYAQSSGAAEDQLTNPPQLTVVNNTVQNGKYRINGWANITIGGNYGRNAAGRQVGDFNFAAFKVAGLFDPRYRDSITIVNNDLLDDLGYPAVAILNLNDVGVNNNIQITAHGNSFPVTSTSMPMGYSNRTFWTTNDTFPAGMQFVTGDTVMAYTPTITNGWQVVSGGSQSLTDDYYDIYTASTGTLIRSATNNNAWLNPGGHYYGQRVKLSNGGVTPIYGVVRRAYYDSTAPYGAGNMIQLCDTNGAVLNLSTALTTNGTLTAWNEVAYVPIGKTIIQAPQRAGLEIMGGNATNYTTFHLGGTAPVLELGYVGNTDEFFPGSSQGDSVIKLLSSQKLLLGSGNDWAVTIFGGGNVGFAQDVGVAGDLNVSGTLSAPLLQLTELDTGTLVTTNGINFLTTNAVPANTNAAKWVKIKIEGVDYAIPASILP